MAMGKGLWIWMMPDDKLKERIQRIINSLGKEFSTPLFVPHVTLAGSNDIGEKIMIKKTKDLSEQIKPFKIKLDGFDYSDNYFSSLFVLCEKTKDLTNANSLARKSFGIATNDYMPHMSLIYTDELSEDQKKDIIKKLGKLKGEFEVKKLSLFATMGPVEKWYKIRDFSLHP